VIRAHADVVRAFVAEDARANLLPGAPAPRGAARRILAVEVLLGLPVGDAEDRDVDGDIVAVHEFELEEDSLGWGESKSNLYSARRRQRSRCLFGKCRGAGCIRPRRSRRRRDCPESSARRLARCGWCRGRTGRDDLEAIAAGRGFGGDFEGGRFGGAEDGVESGSPA